LKNYLTIKTSKMKAFNLIFQLLLIYCIATLVAVSSPESVDYKSTFIRATIIAAPFMFVWFINFKRG